MLTHRLSSSAGTKTVLVAEVASNLIENSSRLPRRSAIVGLIAVGEVARAVTWLCRTPACYRFKRLLFWESLTVLACQPTQ